jgi:hypothetical protein
MGLDQEIDAGDYFIEFTKSNFVHNFFEKKLNRRILNCEYVDITKDMIIELKEACERVIENHELAKELLPTKRFKVFEGINPAFTTGTDKYDGSYYSKVSDLYGKLIYLETHFELIDESDLTYYAWW